MWILLCACPSIGKACFFQDLDDALFTLGTLDDVIGLERFLNLSTNTPHWVEVRHRVLRHQTNVGAADTLIVLVAKFGDVLTIKDNLTVGHLAVTR